MDFTLWLHGAAIVFAGNLVTATFAWFIYQAKKAEREGRDTWRLPFKVYLAGSAPLLFLLWSLMMVKPS